MTTNNAPPDIVWIFDDGPEGWAVDDVNPQGKGNTWGGFRPIRYIRDPDQDTPDEI